MSQDLLGGQPLISLRASLETLPPNVPRPHEATLRHWAKEGVDIGGRRVRLAAMRRGRRWFTTAAALLTFLRDVNATTAGGNHAA